MAYVLVGKGGAQIEIGSRHFLGGLKWTLVGTVPPCSEFRGGLLVMSLVSHGLGREHKSVIPDDICAEFQQVPDVDPRRSKDGMSFGTAAHEFKFQLGAQIVAKAADGVTATVLLRVYGADDGDPYYQVRWYISGVARGVFLETAESLEKQYLAL